MLVVIIILQKAMLETSVQYLDIIHRVQLLKKQTVSIFVH